MQFAVPQFTDVEDKLIGPLTLKQFLVVMATGGLVLFFYSLLKLSVFFFFFAIPVGLVGLMLTFGKFNGRPMLQYAAVFVTYLTKPQVRVFKREEISISNSVKAEKKEEVAPNKLEEPNQSRLKKLAYLLDQQTLEQKALLESKK